VLTTFGLLSRGKGIEYVIKALTRIVRKHPGVIYLVLGSTHPVVLRNEGEKYRIELMDLVKKLKLSRHVKFYDQYLSLPDLLKYLKATDIYIATTTNPNQAVSGTFSYAMGTGRAVVSTKFSQALEMVTPGTGELVDIGSPRSYAQGLERLLENPKRLKKVHQKAYRKTRSMLWTNVAHEYLKLLVSQSKFFQNFHPILPPLKINHLRNMTDSFGLMQFAQYDMPMPSYGYTLDDNARALVVCNWLMRTQPRIPKNVLKLLKLYLNFLTHCQKDDGTFVNYIDYRTKKPTTQNKLENLEDAYGRALWALSETIANEHLSSQIRNKALRIWQKAIPHNIKLEHLRSRALAIKALYNMSHKPSQAKNVYIDMINKHAQTILSEYKRHKDKKWQWFDDSLTYSNAVIPESLILAGDITKNASFTSAGKKTLVFLIRKTFMGDIYVPIGQNGWYRKKKRRNYFNQQPEDTASMILALESAHMIFHNMTYKHLTQKAFTWFLGNNLVGLPLYNHNTGGCFDGLGRDKVNPNQGAESLVSYLLARLATEELPKYASSRNKRSFPQYASSSLQHSSVAKV
jgi:hypothetical protein